MDPVVIVDGIAEIGPVNPEATIDLPAGEWENLLDVRLQLHGVPARPVNGYVNAQGINVWFSSLNLTGHYTRHLVGELNRRGAEVRKAYTETISSLRRYWAAHPVLSLEVEQISEADAARISNTPWDALFGSLGDDKTGPGGVYHPFNFVFARVPAAPFSLRRALEPEADPRSPILQKAQTRALHITGASQLLEAAAPPPAALALRHPMRVHYRAELVYRNPFEEYVAGELENLSATLSATGPIQTAIAKQASTLQTLKDEVWQTALKAQGVPAALDRLEKLIEEIKPDLRTRA